VQRSGGLTRAPGPDTARPSVSPGIALREYPALHNRGVEHRFVAGAFDQAGLAHASLSQRRLVTKDQDIRAHHRHAVG
jgi:hypothetical protein